jgi:prephenate dehydrogenase
LKKSLSIIGFGTFGQFIAPHLTPHFEVSVWNRTDYMQKAQELQVKWVSIKEALQSQIIILCTNISYFEEFLIENASFFNPYALVIDVASVKIKPLRLMQQYLPKTCEIVATHPLFGPQSGKNGIAGLNMVVCKSENDAHLCVVDFCKEILKLQVYIKTAEEHDKEMAYVQGLTHYIARAVSMLNLPETPLTTKAFEHLKTASELLKNDSIQLFMSIENDNPYSDQVRQDFNLALQELEKMLKR